MIKKYIIGIALMYFATHSAMPIETSSKGSRDEKWNFELYNKKSKPVVLSLEFEGTFFDKDIISKRKIPSMGKIRTSINEIGYPLILKIWDKEKPGFFEKANIAKYITVCGQSKSCNKTIFLTLDDIGIRPQTGTFMGFSGKTDSGLDNSKNINNPFHIKNYKE